MATVEMHESSFSDIVEGNNLVIIDFWAEWCGPCRAYAPVFERVSEEFPDVVFAKVDTEVEQALAGSFGIRSIPTTIAFKEGIGVFMQPGALPEDALRDLIEKLQGLDMNEVRAELEARES
jgi:thioredoxin 1|tara:strand:- start:448 stop:810 length:363 start_codon:yes stop_codon:yes gene_type:complete